MSITSKNLSDERECEGMEKYSVEWKVDQNKKYGGWAQDHKNEKWGKYWKWHFIQYGTEYRTGFYGSKRECETENKKKIEVQIGGWGLIHECGICGKKGVSGVLTFNEQYEEVCNVCLKSKCIEI